MKPLVTPACLLRVFDHEVDQCLTVEPAGPEVVALTFDYFERHLAAHSAIGLRLAVRAARVGLARRFEEELRAAEELYLGELMATEDAVEGLEAFLAKRKPEWRNR